MVSLKDAHADTGVMGDLFKREKKKGDNSHQTEVIQTTLPLLKDSDRLPLFRETVGRGLLPRFRAPLQRTGEAHTPNTQTFLISKRERL